jgi:transglutaminase-like putative cysteine protease
MGGQGQDHFADATGDKPPGVVDRYFEVSLLLMLATSFTTLALTGKLDIPSTLVFSAALVLKLWKHLGGVDFNLQPSTATRLGILCVLFYALDVLMLSPGPALIDRVLSATVHLVLFATAIKVFSARTYRDYGYLAALSFLMMLAAAVYTVSTLYLAGLTLYILVSVSTFAGYEIKRSSEAAGREKTSGTRSGGTGVPPVKGHGQEPVLIPRSREKDGHATFPLPSRGATERALLTASGALALGIVVLASLLFFAVPRYRTGYLTALASQAEHITGFSETVNLGDIRKIKRSNVVVMRVRIEGPPRLFQGVKWRGVGLTSFDGKRWFNDSTDRVVVSPASPDRFLLPPPEGWQSRPHLALRYRVLLSPLSTDVLFVATVPRQVAGRFRLLSLDQTQSLHNPQRDNSPFGYDVTTEAGVPTPEQLRRTPTDYPADIRFPYLTTPALNPAVVDLARQLTASAASNYDRALAIQNYLHQSFGYTLDPAGIEPGDPIGSFLFKAKQGYCEYFAAAMALMLRTVNIPSRLVNGFQTGSYNRVAKDFVVRARDAHTWVEVYFPGYGWIPFDPTPADASPVAGSWGELDDYLDALSVFWSEWIINYDFGHQVRLAREIDRQSWQLGQSLRRRLHDLQRQGGAMAGGVASGLVRHPWLVLCLTFLLLGGLVLAVTEGSLEHIRWFWLRRVRRHDPPLNAREATLFYERLLRILRKKGFERRTAQTPREFALELARTPLASKVEEITELYTVLRFGRAPVSLARLRQLIEEIDGKR